MGLIKYVSSLSDYGIEPRLSVLWRGDGKRMLSKLGQIISLIVLATGIKVPRFTSTASMYINSAIKLYE